MIPNILDKAKNIDLYINYQCGLRCTHCFIGDKLELNYEIPLDFAYSIINRLHEAGIENITLLGGEPTLYKNIEALISFILLKNIGLRVVTNGQKPCLNLLKKLPQETLKKIHFCFSVDGADSKTNDAIRGKGTFERLEKSIQKAKDKNVSISGITSLSLQNKDGIFDIIDFCSHYGLKYLNIHYVTDRGFAQKNTIIPFAEWTDLCDQIENYQNYLPLRLEKTFIEAHEELNCEVNLKENLIIDAYGKVFGCTIFMNIPNAQSGIFTSDNYIENRQFENENQLCSCTKNGSCPGISLTNKELTDFAHQNNKKLDCFFNKSLIE